MKIEVPDISELETVADLWVDLARDQRGYGSHLESVANRDRIRESLARNHPAGGVLVAREDGRIVGFVTFSPETRLYERDAERGTVHNIYVRPERRGRGIGSELLAAAEARLAALGVEIVTLEALAENEGAHRFYERHGYEAHRIEFEKPIGFDDAVDQGHRGRPETDNTDP